MCTSNCFQYKGTLDVFNKVVRQVIRLDFMRNEEFTPLIIKTFIFS